MMRLIQCTLDGIALGFKALAVLVLLSSGPFGWIILYLATRREPAPEPEPKPAPEQAPADWPMTHTDRKGIDQ